METTTIYKNNYSKLHRHKLLDEIFYKEIVNSTNALQWLEKDNCTKLKEKWKIKEPRLQLTTFVQLAHLFSCIVFCLRRNPFLSSSSSSSSSSSQSLFVPSLYESYLDIYDEDLKANTGMSLEKKHQFIKDLDTFVQIFTGNKDNCLVREFSDISFELVKQHKKTNNSNNNQDYTNIIDYTNSVFTFYNHFKQGEKQIESLISEVFEYNEEFSTFHIRKKLKLNSLINKFRDIMLLFISETEDNYADVVSSWETFIRK